MDLRGRSLLKEIDLTREEFVYLVDLGHRLREEKRSPVPGSPAGRAEHRPDLREGFHPDPFGLRGRRARRGSARHLPRARGIPSRHQRVGERHRPRPRAHVRWDRVPRLRSGNRRDHEPVRWGAGVERAHRPVASDPDAGRCPDHAGSQRQARLPPVPAAISATAGTTRRTRCWSPARCSAWTYGSAHPRHYGHRPACRASRTAWPRDPVPA